MSLQFFIDNLISQDFDISDTNLIKLRESCSELKNVLDDIYSRNSSRLSRKNYNSFQAHKYIQTKIYKNPDLFYYYTSNNVSIGIVNIHNKFYVKVFNFDISYKSVQTLLDSRLFNLIDLFTQGDFLTSDELKDISSKGFKLFGGVDKENFSDMVIVFDTIVMAYINSKLGDSI